VIILVHFNPALLALFWLSHLFTHSLCQIKICRLFDGQPVIT
jgi:hypothetical protein